MWRLSADQFRQCVPHIQSYLRLIEVRRFILALESVRLHEGRIPQGHSRDLWVCLCQRKAAGRAVDCSNWSILDMPMLKKLYFETGGGSLVCEWCEKVFVEDEIVLRNANFQFCTSCWDTTICDIGLFEDEIRSIENAFLIDIPRHWLRESCFYYMHHFILQNIHECHVGYRFLVIEVFNRFKKEYDALNKTLCCHERDEWFPDSLTFIFGSSFVTSSILPLFAEASAVVSESSTHNRLSKSNEEVVSTSKKRKSSQLQSARTERAFLDESFATLRNCATQCLKQPVLLWNSTTEYLSLARAGLEILQFFRLYYSLTSHPLATNLIASLFREVLSRWGSKPVSFWTCDEKRSLWDVYVATSLEMMGLGKSISEAVSQGVRRLIVQEVAEPLESEDASRQLKSTAGNEAYERHGGKRRKTNSNTIRRAQSEGDALFQLLKSHLVPK